MSAPTRATRGRKPAMEMWPTSKPRPYAKNPRKIGEAAISAVATSIQRFGFRNPIAVDGEGVVINGHTRLLAAQRLGLAEVPVIVVTDLTPEQARAFRIADNRVGEFAQWDLGLLSDELSTLARESLDFAGIEELLSLAPTIPGAGETTNPDDEWTGMPEFTQDAQQSFKRLVVHFVDQAAVDAFAQLVGQPITANTRFLWYPQITIERYADKHYVSDDDKP